ncbi:hypothetical protein LTR35_016544 [Friedmanniomyces endolithicus]|uniref:Uncharacterized protein n=1 Tax=Friedmanniomyces endolithicus TaxID=329885 RepID=A0AAN6F8M9_9PEZI|nr:hypothetical protein LTR35_016544 [Friedmanniomyces endolithicus]KAK0273816.1 hypothetical protein LTS00_015666 [Friedmanniomyces endolithicus]KAK0306228.1 hypothetical protein LTR82_016443 [Friedmanniomyces endolithicus]KAK0978027.1 hypothetical protein LTR54_016052 [Friedmanniomyces endolithicus]
MSRRAVIPDSESDGELSERSATPPAPELPRVPGRTVRKFRVSRSKSDSELSDRSATPSTPEPPEPNERRSGRATVSGGDSDTELSDRSATPPRPSVTCTCTAACTCATHAYFSRGFAASAMHLGSAALDEMAARQPVSALRETLGRGRDGSEERGG